MGGQEAVRAAGGVVFRRRGGRLEVLVVHRPRHDDWSLPKGKCEPDEDDLACALREIREETGLECAPGPELPSTRYRDAQERPKVVRYFAMEAPADAEFRPNDEADTAVWLEPVRATAALTYPRDRDVLAGFRTRFEMKP